ncbi:MarR family winged helix-turn-helix transcriptional regulator [Acetobacter oeni]|uniref:MarR family transcriptional regulator n=1 Tax=Acetobacter oeni TaxID=304077 RepID=A0A511XJ36_9PROT|nr:MarR family transcriptional regulator [Acetobacter oeni]MBB3882703.1 DNA-binding MarR family transcriptional regulator [Acetobacter oeni]NHO18805.1 MarR family transcriptional regulator [Acetobacter oeni]GBR04228.1 MarR family transcriptional regulator [Acetobacter oeni LMG 21952]GEN62956.1 MarR family transcriptional regulator [Acetobacter oeni]
MPGNGLLFLREQQIRFAQELMLLAWRELGRVIAPVLDELGLGAAQYRVLQILALHPALTVGALQDVLGVTKQSLTRTLGELQERGLVLSKPGRQDRRQRFLTLTESGQAAEARLFAVQREQLVIAYREAGGTAVLGFRQVLLGMLSDESRIFLTSGSQLKDPSKGKTRDGQ